jgi:hypothetical protein
MSYQEERVIWQGKYPAQGGGDMPIQGEQKQVFMVSGKFAWNMAGTTANPAPAAAEVRHIEILMTPHGFLKRVMAPGANPVLITRYESGALGGLSSAAQRKLNIISFVALEGATIVTHANNRDFYKQEILTYALRMLEPDLLSKHPPTEFAEGYQFETVDIKHTLSDGTRNLDLYYVQGQPSRRRDVDGVSAEGEDPDRSGRFHSACARRGAANDSHPRQPELVQQREDVQAGRLHHRAASRTGGALGRFLEGRWQNGVRAEPDLTAKPRAPQDQQPTPDFRGRLFSRHHVRPGIRRQDPPKLIFATCSK